MQYFERDAALAEAAGRNCSALGISNIEFHCEEIGPASELPECDLIYADPARRSGLGRKLFRLGDCSPDIGVLAPLLLRKAPALMVKLSPMADISVLRESFGERLKEVHVVAVGGEVKELLCILERGSRPFGGIYAVDAVAPPEEEGVSFSFLPEEEKEGLGGSANRRGRSVMDGWDDQRESERGFAARSPLVAPNHRLGALKSEIRTFSFKETG